MLIFQRFRTQDVGLPRHDEPSLDMPVNEKNIKAVFAGCDDFVTRVIAAGGTAVTVTLCWMDGTVSSGDAAEQILRPLSDPIRFGDVKTAGEVLRRLRAGAVCAGEMRVTSSMDELAEALSFE